MLACVLFVILGVTFITSLQPKETYTYGELMTMLDEGKIEAFEIKTDGSVKFLVKKDDGTVTEVNYRLLAQSQMDTLLEKGEILKAEGKLKNYTTQEPSRSSGLLSWLPIILILVVLIGFWIYAMNQTTGKNGKMMSFTKAKYKLGANEKNQVKFVDVAGADEEKEELKEIVEFLSNPQKFVRLGAKIPRGVLLVGPPGTGKTLLAKAVAGEAGVPFYSISGSDFVEMYVGLGASRVRDLFDTAKRNPASIVFIDEIDAVGRHRGAGLGGGHDEREQTLNQLLVEMDGFGNKDGIIVIAATNRPDILDPALLRPGRFDRQITVNYPDLRGREDILKVHVRNKPLAADVDLKKVAQTTVGFTGADLANLLNEAAILAAREGKHLITMADIEKAALKIIVGTEKKKRKMSDKERRNTAFHEAGHAIVSHAFDSQDPVRRISIIPSNKGALGYTLNVPEEDKYSVYCESLKEEIAVLLGGRAAEKIIFGDVSGGASNDIQRATSIARSMVTKWGMSEELGAINYGSSHSSDEVFLGRDFNATQDYSESTAAKIDSEIKKIIDGAMVRAESILRSKLDKLHFIAEFLLENEVMDGEQFEATMSGDPTKEELIEMADSKRRKNEEEDARKAADEERLRREQERIERELADRERSGFNNNNNGNS